jgi:hypothetical protein
MVFSFIWYALPNNSDVHYDIVLQLGCPRKCFFTSGGIRSFLKNKQNPVEFSGIFTVKSAEFRGIPYVFAKGIPDSP